MWWRATARGSDGAILDFPPGPLKMERDLFTREEGAILCAVFFETQFPPGVCV